MVLIIETNKKGPGKQGKVQRSKKSSDSDRSQEEHNYESCVGGDPHSEKKTMVFSENERQILGEPQAYNDFLTPSQLEYLRKRSRNFSSEDSEQIESRSQLGKRYLKTHYKSENMIRAKYMKAANSRKHHFILNHDGQFRVYWDTMSIVFTVFLLVFEPFVLAFSPNHRSHVLDAFRGKSVHAHKVIAGVRIVSSVWFFIDLLLNCITSYARRDGKRVIAHGPVFKHYAKSWLLFDFFSTVPWESLALGLIGRRRCQHRRGLAFFLDLIPVARAHKFSKFVIMRQLYDTTPDLSEIFGLPPAVETLFWALIAALLINHLYGCVWYALGYRFRILNYDLLCAAPSIGLDIGTAGEKEAKIAREECTWIQINGFIPSRQSKVYLYTTCLYWSLTTVSTVGYGDFTPNTPLEKIYTCIVMLSGVSWFAILVSSVGDEVANNSSTNDSLPSTRYPPNNTNQQQQQHTLGYSKAAQKRMKRSLKAFMYKHNVDMELSTAINAYLRRHFEVDQPWIDSDEFPEVAQLVQQLNKPLLRALAIHVFKQKTLDAPIPFFDTKPSNFIADCIISMRSYVAGPAETLVHKGTILRAVHLIVTGTALADRVHDDDDFLDDEEEDETTISPTTRDHEYTRHTSTKKAHSYRRGSSSLAKNLLSLVIRHPSLTPDQNKRMKPVENRTNNVSSEENDDTIHGDDHKDQPRVVQTADECFWRLDAGEYYGEEGILLGAVWLKPLLAVSWCELMIIPDNALNLAEHKSVQHDLKASANAKVKLGGPSLFYVVQNASSRNLNSSPSVHKTDSFPSVQSNSDQLQALQETMRGLQAQLTALQNQLTSAADPSPIQSLSLADDEQNTFNFNEVDHDALRLLTRPLSASSQI